MSLREFNKLHSFIETQHITDSHRETADNS